MGELAKYLTGVSLLKISTSPRRTRGVISRISAIPSRAMGSFCLPLQTFVFSLWSRGVVRRVGARMGVGARVLGVVWVVGRRL